MPTPVMLRQEAGQFYTQARDLQALIEKEKRNFNPEELIKFNQLMDDAEARVDQAKALERASSFETNLPPPPTTVPKDEGDKKERTSRIPTSFKERCDYRASIKRTKRDEAFVEYLRRGFPDMNPELRTTLQADLDVGGGFFAASETFINRVLQNVDDKLIIRQLATVFTVGRNETLGVPTLTGDLTAFAYGAGELTDASEDTGIAFGKRELKPRDMKRKTIKISRALLESSKIDVEAFIANRIAYALASGEEAAFMTGTGAGQPLGLFTASDDGIGTARDVNIGSVTDFTADGLITVQGTLRDNYQPNARWLLHRDAISKIRKLKDGNGQYLWVPGLFSGAVNQILGKPYITGDNVPKTFTSALYGGMYGDFSYYWIADADTMRIQRLIELYATTGQIGLLVSDLANDAAPVVAEAFVRIKMSV